MNHKITLKDVFNYIQGNASFIADEKFGILPEHLKEQIAYREMHCSDKCRTNKKCQHCGCAYPAKLHNITSCNKTANLPDLMSESEWIKYKTTNNIV